MKNRLIVLSCAALAAFACGAMQTPSNQPEANDSEPVETVAHIRQEENDRLEGALEEHMDARDWNAVVGLIEHEGIDLARCKRYPLFFAIFQNAPENVLKLMIKRGAHTINEMDIPLNIELVDGELSITHSHKVLKQCLPAVYFACMHASADMIKTLVKLELPWADDIVCYSPNTTSEKNCVHVLDLALVRFQQRGETKEKPDHELVDLIKFFVSKGFDINRTSGGRTFIGTLIELEASFRAGLLEAVVKRFAIDGIPLHLQLFQSHIIIKELMKLGADPNLWTIDSSATKKVHPVALAIRCNNKDAMQVLLEGGACVTREDACALLSESDYKNAGIQECLKAFEQCKIPRAKPSQFSDVRFNYLKQ